MSIEELQIGPILVAVLEWVAAAHAFNHQRPRRPPSPADVFNLDLSLDWICQALTYSQGLLAHETMKTTKEYKNKGCFKKKRTPKKKTR